MSDLTVQQIAEPNQILRVKCGSDIHGVSVGDQDDRDEMGVAIEPPEYVIGLAKVLHRGVLVPFEQWTFRSQPEGARSGPGDLDLTIYSLRKWTVLAMKGNPTVLTLLFATGDGVLYLSPIGQDLREQKDKILSKNVGMRYLGYLDSQRKQLTGQENRHHPKRPELIEAYGFDTKFAYHATRLGIQGVELMTTGQLTLPMPEPDRQWLKDLRVGKHTEAEALERIRESEAMIQQLLTLKWESPIRTHPDYDYMNDWLVRTYQRYWRGDYADCVEIPVGSR